MKKLILMLLASLMLFSMVGCLRKGEETPEKDMIETNQNAEDLAPLVWSQIESKVVDLENSLIDIASESENGLLLATDEELSKYVKTVEEAYELVKDGFKTGHEKVVLDLYEAARRLELSGNDAVKSLGSAAKEYMLGMLGHTVVEDVENLLDTPHR